MKRIVLSVAALGALGLAVVGAGPASAAYRVGVGEQNPQMFDSPSWQSLELKRNGKGAYEATVDLPSGLWEATVTAPKTELGPFELRERIRVETAK